MNMLMHPSFNLTKVSFLLEYIKLVNENSFNNIIRRYNYKLFSENGNVKLLTSPVFIILTHEYPYQLISLLAQ